MLTMHKLKTIALVLIAVGAISTVCLSGFSAAVFTCSPYLVFAVAVGVARRPLIGACTLAALILAIAYGAYAYHDALWVHSHGEIGALAVIFVPIVQGGVALLMLFVAYADRAMQKAQKP